MATTSTSTTQATSKLRSDASLLPYLPPTPTPSTPVARTLSHVHTVIPPLLLLARWNALITEPVPTLTQLAPVLAVLQGAYCIVCISSGTGLARPETEKKARSNKTSKGHTGAGSSGPSPATDWARRIVPALLALTCTLILAFPALLFFTYIHGAPLFSHHPQTLSLALHLALLAFPPLFYSHNLSSASWRALIGLAAPLDAERGAALGTVLGAWLGAIPIPLDWERQWQTWPVTVVVGSYLGWAIGKSLGGSVLWGKGGKRD